MSFESDLNQFLLYDNIKQKYLSLLQEKYINRTFTVLQRPLRDSYFRDGEVYAINGFTTYGGEVYIINREGGINRTINLHLIELNPLPSRVHNGIIISPINRGSK